MGVDDDEDADLPAHYMSLNIRGGRVVDLNTQRTRGDQVNTKQTAAYRVIIHGLPSYKSATDKSVATTEDEAERRADAEFLVDKYIRSMFPSSSSSSSSEHLKCMRSLLRHTDMSVEIGFSRKKSAAAIQVAAPLQLVQCSRFFV